MDFTAENFSANSALIDQSYLLEITGGDEELRTELISMFETETITQLAQIREAGQSFDATPLKQAIHKYRSSLFSVGLLGTALKYKEIETSLKEGKTIDNLTNILSGLEAESQSGLRALKLL